MGTNAKSPYQQVIEKTKDLAYKSQMLVMAVEKKLRKGGKEVCVSRFRNVATPCFVGSACALIYTFVIQTLRRVFPLSNSKKVIPYMLPIFFFDRFWGRASSFLFPRSSACVSSLLHSPLSLSLPLPHLPPSPCLVLHSSHCTPFCLCITYLLPPVTYIFQFLIVTSPSVFISPHGLTISVLHLQFFSLTFALVSFVLICSILLIPIIRLNILVSILSSKSCSSFFNARVSLRRFRTTLMTFLCTAALSVMSIILVAYYSWHLRHFPHPAPTRCVTSSSQPPFSLMIEPGHFNFSTCFILSFVLSDTRWLPDFARVPYYAPSPCHMHPQTCAPSVFFRICYGIQPRIRKYGFVNLVTETLIS